MKNIFKLKTKVEGSCINYKLFRRQTKQRLKIKYPYLNQEQLAFETNVLWKKRKEKEKSNTNKPTDIKQEVGIDKKDDSKEDIEAKISVQLQNKLDVEENMENNQSINSNSDQLVPIISEENKSVIRPISSPVFVSHDQSLPIKAQNQDSPIRYLEIVSHYQSLPIKAQNQASPIRYLEIVSHDQSLPIRTHKFSPIESLELTSHDQSSYISLEENSCSFVDDSNKHLNVIKNIQNITNESENVMDIFSETSEMNFSQIMLETVNLTEADEKRKKEGKNKENLTRDIPSMKSKEVHTSDDKDSGFLTDMFGKKSGSDVQQFCQGRSLVYSTSKEKYTFNEMFNLATESEDFFC